MKVRGLGINLTIGDEDVDVTVRGTAVPKHAGSRYEPGHGPSVDDYRVVRDDTGQDITDELTEAQLERVVEAVLEEAQARDDDARERCQCDRLEET